jgi:hypothetical protein
MTNDKKFIRTMAHGFIDNHTFEQINNGTCMFATKTCGEMICEFIESQGFIWDQDFNQFTVTQIWEIIEKEVMEPFVFENMKKVGIISEHSTFEDWEAGDC